MSEPVTIHVQQPPVAHVGDVLFVTAKAKLTNAGKRDFVEWLASALAGTSLEHCRIVLLDDDMGVELLRGEFSVT